MPVFAYNDLLRSVLPLRVVVDGARWGFTPSLLPSSLSFLAPTASDSAISSPVSSYQAGSFAAARGREDSLKCAPTVVWLTIRYMVIPTL